MARSKRNRVVSLTKTGAKGRDLKTKMIEQLREAIEEYKHIYVLRFENLRVSGSRFREIRQYWRESKIYLGKKTVAQVALGRSNEDEFKDNLCNVSKKLTGDCGLLMTNRTKKEVLAYFKDYKSPEFALAGTIPNEDVIMKIGELDFPTSMLDQFRQLGLIVEINDSKMILREKFVAAKKNVPITPEQAKVLVHLNKPLINFTIKLECHWNDGKYTEF